MEFCNICPAPVAYLPFGGMKESQYADIKAQPKTRLLPKDTGLKINFEWK